MRVPTVSIRRGSVAALVALVAATSSSSLSATPPDPAPAWLESYREPAARLIGEAMSDTFAWRRLAVLTDSVGNRLSGTPQLDRAIQWAVAEMKSDGLENVHTEKAMVPRWVRGTESAEIVQPAHHPIAMLGLGNSVGTRPAASGGDPSSTRSTSWTPRRGCARPHRLLQRALRRLRHDRSVPFEGPSRAAACGAVGMLIRRRLNGLRLPHTGALQYSEDAPKIPSAAVSSEDADRLDRMAERGRVTVKLTMAAHFEPDVESANVVGEIRGREKPDEVVVVSGHLDSWDVGAGATDDGGGCVVSWEALRIMKKLNMRPRRTVRVVLWTNEENGGRGGLAYRDAHRDTLANHVLMMESDNGVFRPLGFGFTGSAGARQTVKAIATLLHGIAADQIADTGEGADIAPSVAEAKIPAMSLDVDGSKYFLITTRRPTRSTRSIRSRWPSAPPRSPVMAYVIADMPQRLGAGARAGASGWGLVAGLGAGGRGRACSA